MQEEDRRRRRAAKRWNERVKLTATFLNGIGIALVVVRVLNRPDTGNALFASLGLAVALHLFAWLVLGVWKSED